MSSIGPQLPPHLSKRKRTPDDESPESPAAKQRATDRNQDEVDLDSDDEDDYGPSAPAAAPPPPSKGPIGPSLPPPNTDEIELEDSDDDDDGIGPSAPPPPPTANPKTKPSIGPTLPTANRNKAADSSAGPAPAPAPAPNPLPAPTKRVQGPAPPPASDPDPDSSSSSDDDDDGYGPALPTSSSQQARQNAALLASAARAAEAEAAKPQRDEWMLALPTAGGSSRAAADPTKLKNRRFNSGPRANTNPNPNSTNGEIASIWTETPEQKRKRLENAVLGRDTSSSATTTTTTTSSGYGINQGKKTDLDADQAARIRGYTEATRGRSLYEEHQASRKGRQLAPDEEEDDPSKRAFDREKDVRSAGRINAGQRRELMSRAADFGGRFAKGKYL